MTHSTYTQEERQKHGISNGLIRFSIGLETLSDLKDGILHALDAVQL
jgi:methionine-gamma-lyase